MAIMRGIRDEYLAVGALGIYLWQSGWLANQAGRVAGSVGAGFAQSFFSIAPAVPVVQAVHSFNDSVAPLVQATLPGPVGTLAIPDLVITAGNWLASPAGQGLLPGQSFEEAYPGYESTSLWDRFRLGWNVSPLGGLWALQ